jgi:hypothetical protein
MFDLRPRRRAAASSDRTIHLVFSSRAAGYHADEITKWLGHSDHSVTQVIVIYVQTLPGVPLIFVARLNNDDATFGL